MGLFVCHKCKCVENTALGHWWSRTHLEIFKWLPEHKGHEGEGLCSECAPVDFSDGSCMAAGAQRTDTVKVLMLVADTARQYSVWPYFQVDTAKTNRYRDTATGYLSFAVIGKEVNDTTFRFPDYKTYWQFGYEVRERVYGIPKEWVWWEQITYLDERLRPLPKSIIVWMAKQL